ncbi:MAG: hypothetical protein HY741_26275 [Chloroflexi bacterium]|nr:hypothetical protein [Chloroflexota bacterium]
MNNRSNLLASPLVLGIGGFVLGLLIGWLLLGAVALSPFVKIVDTDPWDLNAAARQQWVTMVADSFSINQDRAAARERLRGFTNEQIADILKAEIVQRNTKGDATGAARLNAFAQALRLNLGTAAQPGATPRPGATPAPGGTGGGSLLDSPGTLLLGLAGVILLVAAALFVYMRLRNRQPAAKPVTAPAAEPVSFAPAQPGGMREQPVTQPPIAPPTARPAATPIAKSLGTFAATYKFGEDNYDTSFTLETTRGEFLGETGMGSSETIGEGKPDKVTAFDVWLFDKTDVRTVTQILMSESAFNDQATRQRLATKGELVLAEKGKSVRLETATLIVDCEIVDLVYASTPGLPPNGHFQKLIVEMVPSQK